MKLQRESRRLVISAAAIAASVWCLSRIRRRQEMEMDCSSGDRLRHARCRVGRTQIFYRYAQHPHPRNALPLVLVHGFGVSGSYFVSLAECMAAERAVYIPDLPGHGYSTTPPRPLDINGLAQSLLDWMDQIGLTRCVVIGQSMGAQIVIEAAIRNRAKFAGLILLGPTSDPHAGLVTHAVRLLQVAPFERLSLFAILLRDYLRMGWRLIPECRAMLRDPLVSKLKQVHLPALLLKGEHDAIVSDRWFYELREGLCANSAMVIPGQGHAVQHSVPGRVADAVKPFLKGLDEER